MALCMSLSVQWATAQISIAGGDGTENNPWQIRTAEQLNLLRNYLGADHAGEHFILTDDIDLTTYLSAGNPGYNEGKGWEPIGIDMNNNSFQASFDGGKHIIRGLWINQEVENEDEIFFGLFGVIGETGKIKDLGVEIASKGIVGNANVGGLAGMNQGTITSCYATGNVKAKGKKLNWVGGLVGVNEPVGIITSCYTTGEVAADGKAILNCVGGLVGKSYGILSSSYSLATVRARGDISYAGGLVGLTSSLAPAPSHCFYYKEEGINRGVFGLGALDTQKDYVPCTSEYTGISPQDVVGMTSEATFDTWDFFDTWTIQEGQTAPYFPWQPEPYPYPEVKETVDTYYTITLSVGEGILLNGLTPGIHSLAEGDHLYLQFLPEDASRTAEDVLLLIDGVEAAFNDFGAGHYFSYILNPITADHTIEIRLREEETPTSNVSIDHTSITLSIVNHQLSITNSGPAVDVAVYSITGKNVVSLRGLRGSKTFALPAGIYVVRAGQQVWKVTV